ncbi:hypothetical protein BU17DRAFT_69758 [Hysterangium stoloniferum]|nr:hypothetical protein BU17DRAFT_69758 [Hysterangium stoloniferum]
MAPSASLQSRIKAFENLQSNVQTYNNEHPKSNGHSTTQGGFPRLSFPPSSVDHHILDSDPTSPTADALISIPPIQPSSSSRPSSPPALGRKSSLIHFSELSSPQLKPTSPIISNGTGSTSSSSLVSDPARKPQLPPRLTLKSPPLPPRKPSLSSLKTASTSSLHLFPKRHASSPVSHSPTQPSGSGALLDLPDSHTYPPALPSRDGGETHEGSLDGSYEALGKRSPRDNQVIASLEKAGYITYHPPPPPPQRRSGNLMPPDGKTKSIYQRPVPIPADVKQRYDALFDRNSVQPSRKSVRSSGWRGVSVDLLTSDSDIPRLDFGESTSGEQRLSGSVVKLIWDCSKLPKTRLREIWNECDQDKVGSLTREQFAQGTWRIDEALRTAQQTRHKEKPPLPPRLPATQLPPVSYNTSYNARNARPPPPLRKPSFLFS